MMHMMVHDLCCFASPSIFRVSVWVISRGNSTSTGEPAMKEAKKKTRLIRKMWQRMPRTNMVSVRNGGNNDNELTHVLRKNAIKHACVRRHSPHFTAVCQQMKNKLFTHKRTSAVPGPVGQATVGGLSQLIADFYFNLFLESRNWTIVCAQLCIANVKWRSMHIAHFSREECVFIGRRIIIMVTAKMKLHESYFRWMHTIGGANKMQKKA